MAGEAQQPACKLRRLVGRLVTGRYSEEGRKIVKGGRREGKTGER